MPRKRQLTYKDEKGNRLYGFSQENLEKTNRELRKTNHYLQALTFIVIIMLVILVASIIWVDINNVITAMIYK